MLQKFINHILGGLKKVEYGVQSLRVRKSVDQALAKKVNNCLIVDKRVRNDPFIQALTNFFLSFVDLLQLVTCFE